MSSVKKLKFNTEGKVHVLNLPVNCVALFKELDVDTKMPRGKSVAQVFLFAEQKKVLEEQLPTLETKLNDETLVWIAYPKKSGQIKSDLSRDDFWDVLSEQGYAPVTQIALDDNWSALRFRKKEAIGKMIRDVPMKDRKIEGIDFEKRTTKLPKDAAEAIKKVKGLETFFYSMSFSHQKEHIEAIVTAKKPETRERRINKMVEMVSEYKKQKEQKKK